MSTLTRRSLLGAALLTGLAACAPANPTSSDGQSPSPSGELPRLTLGLTYVPDIQFAPVYVAHHFGWFDEEGVSVTPVIMGPRRSYWAHSRPVTRTSSSPAVARCCRAAQNRSRSATSAPVYQTYPCVIVVPTDRRSSPGRPPRTQHRSAGEYGENWFYLLAVLGAAGLTRDDVDIQSIGYATRRVDR